MTSVFPFAYDEQGYMGNDKTFIITAQDESISLKYLTAIFNSKLCKLWIWYNCPELLGGTREIRKVYFENFAIPACDNACDPTAFPPFIAAPVASSPPPIVAPAPSVAPIPAIFP